MRTLLAGLGIVASLAVMYVGCGLDTKGNQADGFIGDGGITSGGGGSAPECMIRDDCPANTDCASYQCTGFKCQVTFVPAGTEIQAGKEVGDCKRIVCTASGTTTLMNVDDDPPPSPDTCTTKTCNEGEVVSVPAQDGVMCGNGLFCKMGVCAGCTKAGDCPTPPECQEVACSATLCEYSQSPDGTKVGDNSVTDDCKKSICNGGVQDIVPDETEIPPGDNNICTSDACDANGLPSYGSTMENGMCAAPATSCHTDSLCKSGMCAPQFQPNGTLQQDVIDGDCKQDACNGTGGKTLVNANDPPTDPDAMDCMVPSCVNGTVMPMSVGNGSACGAGGMNDCCGGTCCATAAAACSGPGGNTCCASGKVCGADCCDSGGAKCGGAANDVCCESGKTCGTSCCNSLQADCYGAGNGMCCESGQVCGTTCCTSTAADCYGLSMDMCCESGKVCAASCCPAADDACLVTGCCASNKVCGLVCCGPTQTCTAGACSG